MVYLFFANLIFQIPGENTNSQAEVTIVYMESVRFSAFLVQEYVLRNSPVSSTVTSADAKRSLEKNMPSVLSHDVGD